jgi:hypothetical protein
MGINDWRGRARVREVWRRIGMEAKAHPGLSAIEEEEEDTHKYMQKPYSSKPFNSQNLSHPQITLTYGCTLQYVLLMMGANNARNM